MSVRYIAMYKSEKASKAFLAVIVDGKCLSLIIFSLRGKEKSLWYLMWELTEFPSEVAF